MPMVQGLLLALALAGLQQEDAREKDLERRIREKEALLDDLDDKIRRAVQEERAEDAERFGRVRRDAKQELDGLRRELELLRRPKAPPRHDWVRDFNAGAGGIWSHFDNSLDLGDGGGAYASLAFKDFIALEYRRWDTDDEATDDDATVAQYLIRFTPDLRLPLRFTEFDVGLALGVFHIGSDGPGGDSDTGLMLSITPAWGYLANEWLRFNVGFAIDLMRTHFNSHHTNTEVDVGITLGAEVAF
jgi:hypothetical protein